MNKELKRVVSKFNRMFYSNPLIGTGAPQLIEHNLEEIPTATFIIPEEIPMTCTFKAAIDSTTINQVITTVASGVQYSVLVFV